VTIESILPQVADSLANQANSQGYQVDEKK